MLHPSLSTSLNVCYTSDVKQKQTLRLFSVLCAGGIIASALLGHTADAAKLVPRRLDGVYVAPGVANVWPTAVMIDNHVDARWQAGLNKASVVYEALAEGGIPRFMAIFAQPSISLIGPVRSARPYFVKYAAEYRAGYAHAGGSPDAINLLRTLRMPNIEGVNGKTAKYFYRSGWNSPHNLYTNSRLLSAAMKAVKYDKYKPTYRAWKFKSDPPLAKRRKGKHGVKIELGGGRAYSIEYAYDRARNIYRRSTGGRPHLDRVTRKQLYAKNVVLILVPKERVLDRKGRIDLHTVGKGKAILLQNGFSTTIKWRKSSIYGRTMFTTLKGKEIEFTRGAVWITVVPSGHRYTLY